jgi:hypothetical protein
VDEIPARIHLLPALNAPVAVILRRKPSKCFHVMRWNTQTGAIEHGSWFRGQLYPLRCDVSFNGEWMVYLALGAGGHTWNGVCRVPWLKTVAEGPNTGTWYGGGYWNQPGQLLLNGWTCGKLQEPLPFRIRSYDAEYGEDEGVLYQRLKRDRWKRAGPFGQDRQLKTKSYMVAHDNDAGWYRQPTPEHPTLRMFYRGYLEHGRTFEFRLDEYPQLLDKRVEWATWDSLGQLLVARAGGVRRYTLADLPTGIPSVNLSFEGLVPPKKPDPAPESG